MPLIEINLAKKHLKVDGAHEDDLITLYLGAAELSAAKYLNRNVYPSQEAMDAAVAAGTAGTDPMLVNDQIKVAILLTLADLHSHRSNTVLGTSAGELPHGAVAFLQPFRIDIGT